MAYTPKTENELRSSMCWPKGIYDFEVTNAEVKTSKNGNAMLALTINVFHPDTGATRQVKDWLVESEAAVCLMKMRHYCNTTGEMTAYESGSIENYPGIGAVGKLKLAIEDNEQYGAQNRVADYVKRDEGGPEKPKPQGVPTSQTQRAMAANPDGLECPF